MNSISANLNIMIKASEKASKILIRDFGEVEKLQISVKGPSDFVSNADTKAEKIIINELMKAKKNYSILSEECGSKINSDSENVWIIDPIDGTTNFLHGVPHFAISIALKSNNEIVSGLIYDPIKDEMFIAEKGNGSYLNNQRTRVSARSKLKDCIIFTGGPRQNSKDKELSFAEYRNFSAVVETPIRKMGSASLDMAYVAAGRCDGFWQRNLNYWDYAAGIIIVKESGGFVTDFKGNNDYIKNKTILVTNSRISEEMIKVLKH